MLTAINRTSCAASYTKLSMSGDALCLTSSFTVGGAIAKYKLHTRVPHTISTGFHQKSAGLRARAIKLNAPSKQATRVGCFARSIRTTRSSRGEGTDISAWPPSPPWLSVILETWPLSWPDHHSTTKKPESDTIATTLITRAGCGRKALG